MRTDEKTIKEIERLFQIYETEVQELENKGILANKTAKTYLTHSNNFVRWCKGEFEPGVKKK